MKLYTKTGDCGQSSLYDGSRLPKTSQYFITLGDLDELNSHIGLVKAFWNEIIQESEFKVYNGPGAGCYLTEPAIDSGKYYEWFELKEYLTKIQCNIMDICSFIATPQPEPSRISEFIKWIDKIKLDSKLVENIENKIDRLDSLLPPIKNFVVPSGNKLVSQIHICRTISRRCERQYLGIQFGNINASTKVIVMETSKYLNRLSDYFFVLSRFVAMTLSIEEDQYSKKYGIFTK